MDQSLTIKVKSSPYKNIKIIKRFLNNEINNLMNNYNFFIFLIMKVVKFF